MQPVHHHTDEPASYTYVQAGDVQHHTMEPQNQPATSPKMLTAGNDTQTNTQNLRSDSTAVQLLVLLASGKHCSSIETLAKDSNGRQTTPPPRGAAKAAQQLGPALSKDTHHPNIPNLLC